jgi:hypothetical protein
VTVGVAFIHPFWSVLSPHPSTLLLLDGREREKISSTTASTGSGRTDEPEADVATSIAGCSTMVKER